MTEAKKEQNMKAQKFLVANLNPFEFTENGNISSNTEIIKNKEIPMFHCSISEAPIDFALF